MQFFSILYLPLTLTLPRPVFIILGISSLFITTPPVGKSGPGSIGSFPSIKSQIAWATSVKLWGAQLHAIATPIPELGLHKRLGNMEGSVIGSKSFSSQFGIKSTTFFFIPDNRPSSDIFANLAFVYLYAAGPSPSIFPIFP